MKHPILLRAGLAACAAALLVVAAPLAASAHIHVTPGQAEAGSSAVLTFKVPNESATAGTVKVSVDLPSDTPFSSVSYLPTPGWTTSIVTTTLAKPVKTANSTITEAPTSVTWTANPGTTLGDGAFQEFVISVSGVPDTGSVLLPAHQSYSDGSVVNWDQPTPASGAEPDNPAPVLYINDAPPADDSAAVAVSSPAPSDAGTNTAAAGPDALSSVALGIGIAALVLGAMALTVSIVVLRRARETDR